jgi:TPR repeat protein
MQEGIAHLELEAREVKHDRMDSVSSIASAQPQYREPHPTAQRASQQAPRLQAPSASVPAVTYDHTNAALYQNAPSLAQGHRNQYGQTTAPFVAKPSPFPKPHILPGQRVPPSNNEKEAILVNSREEVLTSSNAEMQLAWAQDALLWIDNEMQCRARLAEVEVVRPGTPKEDQLRKDAIDIVNFLADQRHPKALFIRATWYEFGKFGYPANRDDAIQGYRAASERGYARAEYRIGTLYEGMQDMARATKHYKAGVTLGDAASNYRLGMMSLLGQHGQIQDQQLGVRRIRYAAEMADENAAQGAYVYGMLLAGELPNINLSEAILPIDIDQARDFMEKAAFLGFAKAQQRMGTAYELCQFGCDFNPALSLHYNALAAHQGEADADMSISKWFLCGYEEVFSKNEELAFTYARRAAQAGSPTAEFAMGYFNEIGMHVPSDLIQAKIWYQKAADHGNKDAIGRLESISQQKTLSKDHEKEAIKRIRSQYGSQRGKRPDRLKEKPMPMPPTVEEPAEQVDMPDPDAARRSVSSPVFMISPIESYATNSYPTVRPKSTAPYPEEDVYPPARPTSTAPYPEDDVIPSRYSQVPSSTQRNPQLRPQQGPAADRPLSAFGIRPGHMQTQNQLGNGYNRAGPPLRPATSMGNMHNSAAVPEGRGSNPAGRHQIMSAGWEPQPAPNYRQPSPYQNPLPPIDTGRLQPVNNPPVNTNVGRNRLQKPAPNLGKLQPSLQQQVTPDPGYPITPIAPLNYKKSPAPVPASQTRYDQSNSNPGVGSRPTQVQPYDARASLPSNHAQRPARLDSMPQNTGHTAQRPHLQQSSSAPNHPRRMSSTPSAESSQFPPRTSSAAPTVSSGPPPSKTSSARPVSSASATQPGKPAKGPQTFEEMGIEVSKNESDCVSLASDLFKLHTLTDYYR